MTDTHNAEQHWFERATRYAELFGRIRGWLDLNQHDPGYFSTDKAVTEIRRLVDKFDKQAANPTGGDRR